LLSLPNKRNDSRQRLHKSGDRTWIHGFQITVAAQLRSRQHNSKPAQELPPRGYHPGNFKPATPIMTCGRPCASPSVVAMIAAFLPWQKWSLGTNLALGDCRFFLVYLVHAQVKPLRPGPKILVMAGRGVANVEEGQKKFFGAPRVHFTTPCHSVSDF
jgi:hypothetical protein